MGWGRKVKSWPAVCSGDHGKEGNEGKMGLLENFLVRPWKKIAVLRHREKFFRMGENKHFERFSFEMP